MIVVKFYFLYVLDTVTILASRLVGVLFKVAGYQSSVAEVGYKTARRLENESKLDEAELAYTENGGIQRSDC